MQKKQQQQQELKQNINNNYYFICEVGTECNNTDSNLDADTFCAKATYLRYNFMLDR